MNVTIEGHQSASGEWKISVRDNLPYFDHIDFEKLVKSEMEDNGFVIFKPVGADQ